MIVDRRTYRILPGHWDQAMALAIHFRQLTRENLFSDYEILTPRYGPYRTICFEWHAFDQVEHLSFLKKKFYPILDEFNGIAEWFSHCDSADSFNYRTVNGAFPHYTTVSDSFTVKELSQACRLGKLISRQFYLPITMGRKDFWPTMLAIQEETQNQFQRDIRILKPEFAGIMSQMYVEFSYSDMEDKLQFDEAWIAHMSARNLLQKFDDEIGQGHSELWYSIP